jgi:zinc D-Ala-D-Ala carboxypeptidase
MTWSSPYFTQDEMRCQCGCGAEGMHSEFMDRLTSLRADWGQPMIVTSAYRCPNHPIEAKKSKPGAHASGRAVDIAIQGEDAYKLLCAILGHGFTGIGVQQKGSGRFIHIDDLTKEEGWPRPTVWSY